MKAARIFYRLLKSGAKVATDGDALVVLPTRPLTESQRQAVTDHKPDLLDLADWYTDDGEVIAGLDEEQFIALVEDYRSKRDRYRSAGR